MGTTGPPKGVMISHRNAVWTAQLLVDVEEIKMILEQQNTGHDLAKGNMARQTQSPANLEGLGLPLPMNNWSH